MLNKIRRIMARYGRYQPIAFEHLASCLHPNLITVILIHTPQWEACLSDCLSVLSPSEQQKYRRFRKSRYARRYAIAHGFLRRILNIMLGDDLLHPAIEFKKNAFGKLSLPDSCPQQLEFNLSYSLDYILLGFAWDAPIGVDIEIMGTLDVSADDARIIMTHAEYQQWQSFNQPDKETSFYRLWVQKEAIVKAQGQGLSLPPHQISVGLFSDSAQVECELIPDTLFSYQQLDDDDTLTACIASTGVIGDIKCYQLTP